MFVCAFDIRQFSLRMVLTVKTPVPIFLEACSFKFPVEPSKILDSMLSWEDSYQHATDYLVGCRQNPWPAQLEETLQKAGYCIKWVELADINKVVRIWKSLQPDARWLRGGLMSYLCPSDDQYQSSSDPSNIRVMEWICATLRDQIKELEGTLIAEGRDMCPGHLLDECPLCYTLHDDYEPEPEDYEPDREGRRS